MLNMLNDYGLDELKKVVVAIKERRPLETSDEMYDLLEDACDHQGTPEDIETWAQRLADDVGSLTD